MKTVSKTTLEGKVLQVVPIRHRLPAAEVFSDVRGRIVYHDDVLDPTIDEWRGMTCIW